MSKLIKIKYPHASVIGNKNIPRSGSFEVLLENKLLFSKFKENRFPRKDEIFQW